MRAALPILLLVLAPGASAAPPAATQREVAALFDALAQSDCRFSRNGSWHDAARARQHLQRKYDYLLERDAVASTERFIELAATRSSLSGRPYLVRCGSAPAVESATWFRRVLARVRGAR